MERKLRLVGQQELVSCWLCSSFLPTLGLSSLIRELGMRKGSEKLVAQVLPAPTDWVPLGLQCPGRGHTRLKLRPQIQATVPGQGNILQPDTWARGLGWAPGDPVFIQGDSWQSAGQPSLSLEVKGSALS